MSFLKNQTLGKSLLKQEWINNASTKRVIDCFVKNQAPFRFVGGCVRDGILKRPVKDIDICTPLLPHAIISLFRDHDFAVYETGLKHGTVTIVSNHQPFEITTLRQDKETDGRRALVEFTDSWQADAARRDFTFNALSLTAEGELFDYFDGISDLLVGIVRFIGNPLDRIKEDHLRILRLLRFQCYYGKSPLSLETLGLVSQHANLISKLSGERIRQEFLKILSAHDPYPTLLDMNKTKLLQQFLPFFFNLKTLESLLFIEVNLLNKNFSLKIDPLRRLAALLSSASEKDYLQTSKILKFSSRQQQQLLSYYHHTGKIKPVEPLTIRQFLYDHGPEISLDLLLLQEAIDLCTKSTTLKSIFNDLELYDKACKIWENPVFPIKGDDVLKLNIREGKEIGRLLDEVKRWWRQHDFRPDHTACMEYVKGLIAASK
ncbi:MAG: CCA tRNA nucleotidyltransferase [Rhodospirillaceae bacterium]|nr:CCA tRNA nucleotidyltransferase [Rhodospirillaceae bacterium]